MTMSLTVALTVVLGAAGVHAAADWPQWQGPDRTRISKETGLLKEWPASGQRRCALIGLRATRCGETSRAAR